MRDRRVDIAAAKVAAGRWIEGLSVSGRAVPDHVRRELLEQLARAVPVVDLEGAAWLEVPGLSSLGVGIFQHSFAVGGDMVHVAPYSPVGGPVPAEPQGRETD